MSCKEIKLNLCPPEMLFYANSQKLRRTISRNLVRSNNIGRKCAYHLPVLVCSLLLGVMDLEYKCKSQKKPAVGDHWIWLSLLRSWKNDKPQLIYFNAPCGDILLWWFVFSFLCHVKLVDIKKLLVFLILAIKTSVYYCYDMIILMWTSFGFIFLYPISFFTSIRFSIITLW